MNASEALRLADEMGIPDLRHTFVEARLKFWHGEIPPACAIGGANIAARKVTLEPYPGTQTLSPLTVRACGADNFGLLLGGEVPCPACKKHRPAERYWIIQNLYDGHKWSRTRIADWVETV